MLHTRFAELEWAGRQRAADDRRPAQPASMLKLLDEGAAGDPGYYEAVVSRYPKPKTYVRHRHRVDQFRYTLAGESPWAPEHSTPPGSMVYIPAGTFYGPYERPAGVELIAVQFAASSGEMFQAKQVADDDPPPRNPFALPAPIQIDPAGLAWVKTGDGGEQKQLLFLEPNDVRICLRRLAAGTQGRFTSVRRQLVFVLSGRGEVLGEDLGRLDCVTLAEQEDVQLSATEDLEVLTLELPRIPG